MSTFGVPKLYFFFLKPINLSPILSTWVSLLSVLTPHYTCDDLLTNDGDS